MKTIRRVGLVTPGWPGQNTVNGIATSVHFLAMGLREAGVTPVILAAHIDGTCPPGIPVIQIPDLKWRLWERLRTRLGDSTQVHVAIARNITAAVCEACEKHALDVVIMEETNGWAQMVGKPAQIPIVITLHGPWMLLKTHASLGDVRADQQREERERRGFMSAASIIAPSRNVLAAVEKVAPLSETPKVVVPNSFRAERPANLSAKANAQDILFVGRFDFLKGADTVLAAFELLMQTHPEARLTFVGPDNGVRQEDGSVIHMEERMAILPAHVHGRLTYKGTVGKEEIARLRKEHGIALIASRFENLNYSLLEAMAAGQAIVSTKVGGPAEVLEHEQTALLVPPGDPDAMACALRRLLDDTSLRVHVAENGRNKLERDFNPLTVAEQIITFINEVLNSPVDRISTV